MKITVRAEWLGDVMFWLGEPASSANPGLTNGTLIILILLAILMSKELGR